RPGRVRNLGGVGDLPRLTGGRRSMERRLLVMGAGSGASNNLIRSLRAGEANPFIVGCHADRFVLKKSPADPNYPVSPPTHPRFAEALCRIVDKEDVQLIIPTQDPEVLGLAGCQPPIASRVLLPNLATIRLCQDKYELTSRLRHHGIPAPETYPVENLSDVDELFERLGSPSRAWCRIRVGTGSRGAIPVES